MKLNGSFSLRSKYVFGSLLAISLFICSSVSYAQVTANFSGVWMQDTVKSDDFYKSFDVKYTITQTLQTFKVIQAMTMRGTDEGVTREYSYTLDGKVTSKVNENGTEKNLAEWSADKKVLNTRSTVAYGNEDVGFTEAYSLSADGKVLTVQKSNIIPGALSVKMVFNKQQ